MTTSRFWFYSSRESNLSWETNVAGGVERKVRIPEPAQGLHESCLVALVFYTKLYIKLAVSLGSSSFSQFSFPFNFRTANALVLKFGKLPLSCRFSNTLLAIFDILFRSRDIHRFVPKNWPKLTSGRVFQHNFISKANLKNPEQSFLGNRFYLLRKQRECLCQGRFSTKKQ